jgi:hypothetical protein
MGRGAPKLLKRPVPLHSGCADFGVLSGWQIVDATVRPQGIVIVLPRGKNGAGMCKAREYGLIQALIPEPRIEALDERILRRLPGAM